MTKKKGLSPAPSVELAIDTVLADLYVSGSTAQECADILRTYGFDITLPAILQRIRVQGVEIRPAKPRPGHATTKLTKQEAQTVLKELDEKELSVAEIGKKWGLSRNSLWRLRTRQCYSWV